jgi:hypothetical protein
MIWILKIVIPTYVCRERERVQETSRLFVKTDMFATFPVPKCLRHFPFPKNIVWLYILLPTGSAQALTGRQQGDLHVYA